jgi:hypothetical protein
VLAEVCCAIDSHVDRTFLIAVSLISAARSFFGRRIMSNLRRNSARILASQKECYAQKNRSTQ